MDKNIGSKLVEFLHERLDLGGAVPVFKVQTRDNILLLLGRVRGNPEKMRSIKRLHDLKHCKLSLLFRLRQIK